MPKNKDHLEMDQNKVAVSLLDTRRVHPAQKWLHKLDVGAFGVDLAARLNDQCVGYVIRLLEPTGGSGLSMQGGRARRAGDGDLYWTPDVRMHVASVSKWITAMAVARALNDTKTPVTTRIAAYLPQYWARGPSIDKVTFEDLLLHTSGFYSPTTDRADYGELKAQIARGSLGVDTSLLRDAAYQNVNYGMLRVLLPVLIGVTSTALAAASGREEDHDALWDETTLRVYREYVEQNVFAPAHVIGASMKSAPNDALAYQWPGPMAGWDSGDLSAIAGTTGWHLSANELVRIGAAFIGGDVLPSRLAWESLEAGWGLDRKPPTPAGAVFLKGGRWESGARQLAQTVAGILPGGLPFALLANSQVGNDVSVIDIVRQAAKTHVIPGL